MGIKDGSDIAQAVAVLCQQITELLLKLDFALQTIVIFQGFELCELSCELLFKCTEFGETRHLMTFNDG